MTEEGTIIRKICNHINGWPGAPCIFLPESRDGGLPGKEYPGKLLPAGAVTALAGTVRLRTYVDGSYIGQMPFAVYFRAGGVSPAERLAVLDWFDGLTAYLEQFTPPADSVRVYGKCRLTELPARSSAAEDGTVEYRAVYTVEYRHTA